MFHCRPINRGKGAPQAPHTGTPAKIVNNCLPLGFHRQLFLPTRPWHHQQTEEQNKCQLEQDVNQVLYSTIDSRQCENKQHSDTMTEKARGVFLFSPQINI